MFVVVACLGACSAIPPGRDFPRRESVALAHPEETRLGSQFASAALEHGGNSGFRIITVGVDGFLARAQMIDNAEKTLDIQYFIFRGDETGRLLTDGLLRAADRGVRVRVLIDDGDTLPGDEQILALNAHPSVEVRVFNPFRYRGHSNVRRFAEFVFTKRLDYRMHNKLLVADNALALVGGRNVGNQYFQVDPASQFADDDVFAAGPIVRELSATFDEFWNSPLSVPAAALKQPMTSGSTISAHRSRARDRSTEIVKSSPQDGSEYVTRISSGEPYAGLVSGRLPLVWAAAQVICDSPDKKHVEQGERPGRLMTEHVKAAIAASQSELLMVTPYFVPAPDDLQALRDLRTRGVTVGVVTNSLNSSLDLVAYAGYTRFREPLVRQGVNLYEIRAELGNSRGSGQSARLSRYGHYGLHGKLFVFDRQRIFIGSMNFDQRSKRLNTEIGLIIESKELADQTAARFTAMAQLDNSYALSLQPTGDGRPLRLRWRTMENGQTVEYGQEPTRSAWRRTVARLFVLLPVEREL